MGFENLSVIEISILVIISLLLGAGVPFGISLSRKNTRAMRARRLLDLEKSLHFKELGGSMLPSFEVVKHKYHIMQDEDKELAGELENNVNYFLPVLLYITLTSSCFFISLTVFQQLYGIDFEILHETKNLSRLVFAFTFLGAFLWTLNYLLRRVANYDLSPLSYFRAFYRILLSLVIVGAVYYSGVFRSMTDEDIQPASAMTAMSSTGAQPTAPPIAAAAPTTTPTTAPTVAPTSKAEETVRKTGQVTLLIIALALLVGLFPLAFIDLLVARFPSLALRRVDSDDKRLMKEYPLDMIIGIDPYMKFRLSEFEIEDVQNLATANPIQIFVETPYGLYEVIDWIAQAQLIIAVGSKKTRLLRSLNIRTVFDLANIGQDRFLRQRVYTILVADPTAPALFPDDQKEVSQSNSIDPKSLEEKNQAKSEVKEQLNPIIQNHQCNDEQLNNNLLEKNKLCKPSDALTEIINIITDDLYIKRLNQLWFIIEKRLDIKPFINENESEKKSS